MSATRAIKLIQFLENAWLVIGVTSVAVGIYESFTRGIEESYMFFIFALVSGILYSLRRRQRILMEKESRDETDQDE